MADRAYGDPCGIARALDRVGERWSLLVVRELMLGAKRFVDLQRGLIGISPNVLTQRLKELEAQGVVRKVTVAPHRVHAYELTDWGLELENVLLALAGWGSQAPFPAVGDLSADALVFSLRTTLDPTISPTLVMNVSIRLGGIDEFTLTIAGRCVDVVRGFDHEADLCFETDVATLRGAVFGRARVDAALRGGGIDLVRGTPAKLTRFVRCFQRPMLHPDALPRT
jgi:DNA-binding HxlR family transcriptional regulator